MAHIVTVAKPLVSMIVSNVNLIDARVTKSQLGLMDRSGYWIKIN